MPRRRRIPNVTVGQAVCPFCRHPRYKVDGGTVRLACGSIRRYVKCLRCFEHYTVTAENDPDLRITSFSQEIA
jgi:transcriptional regulator NrdR family protein